MRGRLLLAAFGPRFADRPVPMHDPVAPRFEAYALPDDGVAHHLRQLLADPAVMRWIEAAKADPRRLSRCDVG